MRKEKHIRKIEVLVVSLSTPLIIGVYIDDVLEREILTYDKASEALVDIFDCLLKEFEISRIIYTNGPGSFMGIKVAYTILRTISIVRDMKFEAVSGFELNGLGAIKANKNMSFILENGEILIKKAVPVKFKLPLNLSSLQLEKSTLPNYILGAV